MADDNSAKVYFKMNPNQNSDIEVSIVVPLYNEEENFCELTNRLISVCSSVSFSTEVVLIDDGSKDATPSLMYDLATKNELFTCVFLSRNHGHQLAVSAGLANASGSEAVFIIDGDLQDPPELITQFYKKLKEGYDVVYGVRRKRKESVFKRFLYWIYYRILGSISNTDVQLDSGDFSIISRRVVNYMNAMPERSRYLRGMRAWIGFKQYGFEYERSARFAGETKYTFKKLFELAYNGIFNFSDFPIKFVTKIGMYTMGFTFIYFCYVVFRRIFFGDVPQGFTTLIFFMALFVSVQLISLGMIGEYVLRIYKQIQNRPLFVIDKIIKKNKSY
jgi:glycosyltransferase involved in cell wall biosynthesis